MIVDVDLIVFNCIFSRAVDLNRCFIDKIIFTSSYTFFYFFFEKNAGPPRRFHRGRRLTKKSCPTAY